MRSKYPQLYHVALVRDHAIVTPPVSGDSPEKIAELFRGVVGPSDREHFVVIMLDGRTQVIGANVVSIGTLSASLVHPRETFKPAILANAAAVIVAHNHPSGDAQPSAEDKDATRRLARAGRILGIPLLDHVVVGEKGFYSFRMEGLLS